MFRKLILTAAVAVCTVSCLKDDEANNSYSYTSRISFDNAGAIMSDSLYFDRQIGLGIGWDDMAFYHKLNEEKSEFLGGFIMSNLKSGGRSENDRFRVNSGTSNTYSVYYVNPDPEKMPERDIEFIMSKYGTCNPRYCLVNNTKEVAEAVKSSFKDGDRLAIKMTGYLAGEKTGEADFLLAEYYHDKKDTVVTTWTYMGLDKLGAIDVIDIEIVSNRNDIPKAFCMDDMAASVRISY